MRLAGHEARGLRRWLWLGGSAVGLVVFVVVVAQIATRLADPSPVWVLGGDFVPAYAAGTLVRQGRAIDVYHPAVVDQVERGIVAEADLAALPYYGPYLNPPFFAAFYAPLSAMPYRAAASVWLVFNLLCVAGAILMLCRMLAPASEWRTWTLVPLLVCISMPFWQSMCHLQNTGLSLILLAGVVLCWRFEGGGMLAGLLAGLLAYKPQIACVVAFGLVATRGWRALAGFAIATAALLGFSIWKLPGATAAYVFELPGLVSRIQQRPEYAWGRQATPLGFWRLLVQGHAAGATLGPVTVLCGLTVGAFALAWVASVFLRQHNEPRFIDRFIAATIACMPLLVPYYMDYDLLLLAIPAVLLSKEDPASRGADRLLPWAWSALFLALYVNPGLSGVMRINFAALLVGTVAALMLARCVRLNSCEQISRKSEGTQLAVAA